MPITQPISLAMSIRVLMFSFCLALVFSMAILLRGTRALAVGKLIANKSVLIIKISLWGDKNPIAKSRAITPALEPMLKILNPR